MHGLGNDFILINKKDINNQNNDPDNDTDKADIIKLSNRYTGIGFDQAIIYDDFNENTLDFNIQFLNADGSHAGGCGNGVRAAAGFFHKKTLKTAFNIHILLPSQAYDITHALILPDHHVKIKMPNPRFAAAEIPLSDSRFDPQQFKLTHFHKAGFCVNIGNPHIVFIINDFSEISLENLGAAIENDPFFPERINVEFIKIIDRNHIQMRVWERGVGITKACGTGACASVIAAAHHDLVNQQCQVILDGGTLDIDYERETHDLYMQGSYNFVYEGIVS